MLNSTIDLAGLFQAVLDALVEQREAFNQADALNANHGDHMVEIFSIAVQAAQEESQSSLGEAMEDASRRLLALRGNGSALVYGSGLACLANQLRERDITLAELAAYVQGVLGEKAEAEGAKPAKEAGTPARSGDVLKALLNGLAAWQHAPSAQAGNSGVETQTAPRGLDVGYLFDLGVAYMQAKGRGGSRAEVIAEAAVSVSPLNEVPHRRASGKLAIQRLLEAFLEQ